MSTGPGPELNGLLFIAQHAPPNPDESVDDRFARHDRLTAVATYDELDPADQAWLDAAIKKVEDGASNSLQDPEVWTGSWSDADDEFLNDEPLPEAKSAPLEQDDTDWVGL